MGNVLYYGDNLDILRGRDGQHRQYFPDECVDLIYLDPPFNSKRSYNLLFRDQHGVRAPSQMRSFDDTWTWANASDDYDGVVNSTGAPFRVQRALRALYDLLGTSEMMAYLAMMTPRLMEMHRVLKATGSLYLHCDPLASHYLKIVLDTIFGPTNFRNEIVWKRTTAHSGAKRFAPVHDILLYYSKSDVVTWNDPRTAYAPEYLEKYYRFDDGDGRLFWRDNLCAAGTRNGRSGVPWRGRDPAEKGMHWKFAVETLDELDAEGRIYWPKNGGMPQYKRYRDELKGKAVPDLWDDIDRINPVAAERLGYQTQKPLALLRRIIEASSNPGDVVLDPFCGCGTAIDAAQELGRAWRGIDVTHLAIDVITARLAGRYDIRPGHGYTTVGIPRDIEDARNLARDNPEQFELWALGLIGALPWEDHQKKGADKGRDGVLVWRDTEERVQRHAVVSVKGGQHIGPDMVRDLIGTVETEQTEMGFLVTLRKPTRKMEEAAIGGGMYQPKYSQERVRKVQILCVEDLLDETTKPQLPKGSLVISQKLPAPARKPIPVQKEMTLLTKVPYESDEARPSRAGAKRKATA